MFPRLLLIVLFGFLLNSSFGQSQIYELRVYELDFFRPAEVLHTYLEKALIPALNRQGVQHVGVFEESGEALQDQITYTRYESSFIRSASGFPALEKPAGDSELFELRIYESYNEDALRRKVKMFNDSEFEIFEEVDLPMVFFGENISGHQMPCLTYLLAFKDKAHHAEAWSKFGAHPEWQRILKLEEYANTVSQITRVFLKPLPYSQL